MITKFNKYNLLLEKSSLSTIIKDNNFIKAFHKKFGNYTSHELEIKKTKGDYFEFLKNLNFYKEQYLKDWNMYLIILDNNIYIVHYQWHKYYILHYENYSLEVYNNSDNINEIINNLEQLFNNNYDNIQIYYIGEGVSLSRNVNFDKETENDRLTNLFLYRYKDVFIKYINSLLDLLEETRKKVDEELRKRNNTDQYLARRLSVIYNDIDYLERYKKNKFDKSSIKNEIYTIDESLKNLGLYSDNYNIKIDKEYENLILLKLKEFYLNDIIMYLSYKKQLEADKILTKDPKAYKIFKKYIFDEEFIKKWNHLEDSEKFDLI